MKDKQKRNFYNLSVLTQTVPKAQWKTLTLYLSTNNSLFLTEPETKHLLSSKSPLQTPVSKFYEAYQKLQLDDLLSFLYVPPKHPGSLPEILTYSHILLDLEQMVAAHPDCAKFTALIDVKKNSSIINLSQLISRDRFGEVSVRNFGQLTSLATRAILSRKFYIAGKQWLAPEALLQSTFIYTSVCASIIARRWAIDGAQLGSIRYCFAFYYLYQNGFSLPEIERYLAVHYRDFLLPPAVDQKVTTEAILKAIPAESKDFTLSALCVVLHHFANTIVVHPHALQRMMGLHPQGVLESAIALEYPPFFVCGCLTALTQSKSPLGYSLKLNSLELAARKLGNALLIPDKRVTD